MMSKGLSNQFSQSGHKGFALKKVISEMAVRGRLMHQRNHPLYQYNQEDICCAVFVSPKKEYFFPVDYSDV